MPARPSGEFRRDAEEPAVERLGQLQTDQTAADADQTASDADQSASDLDQGAVDTDQAQSDSDQAQADSDQDSSDQDQATADRDQAAHPDGDTTKKQAYDTSRADRNMASQARDITSLLRARSARNRADGEAERTRSAARRDRVADARDRAADLRDAAATRVVERLVPRDATARAALEYAASVREVAADARTRAAEDRRRAAIDREHAATDREQAARDRSLVLAELRQAHLDDLTGAYLRPIGLAALQQEIDRARRSDGRLILAFVDVDHLKSMNDRLGHHAGDELLRRTVSALRAKMRSYEPIIRFGGDEFICAIQGVDIEAARTRFRSVKTALATAGNGGSMSFGLAALGPDDSLEDLIGRADDELRKVRAARA